MKKWIGRLAILAIVGILAIFVIAFISLNSIVKKGVETVGPTLTKTPVTLDAAVISVLSGNGELKDFVLGNPEGFKTPSAVRVGEIKVAVQPGSLLSDKVIVKTVNVTGPQITYEAAGLKQNNLSKILENIQNTLPSPTAGTNKTEETGAARKIQLDDLVITGGTVQVSATILGGQSLTVPLPEIRLSGLGQGPEGITIGEVVQKVFAAVLDGTLKAVGQSVGNIGGKALDDAKDIGKGALEQGKGIRDLFRKKE